MLCWESFPLNTVASATIHYSILHLPFHNCRKEQELLKLFSFIRKLTAIRVWELGFNFSLCTATILIFRSRVFFCYRMILFGNIAFSLVFIDHYFHNSEILFALTFDSSKEPTLSKVTSMKPGVIIPFVLLFIVVVHGQWPYNPYKRTYGAIWPLPQEIQTSSKVWSINPESFKIVSDYQCDITTDAINRYMKRLFPIAHERLSHPTEVNFIYFFKIIVK